MLHQHLDTFVFKHIEKHHISTQNKKSTDQFVFEVSPPPIQPCQIFKMSNIPPQGIVINQCKALQNIIQCVLPNARHK